MSEKMQTFTTGATRSADDDKIDPEGFLSPLVIRRYCEYLHKHRVQADGQLRASDNWQLGMPRAKFMKSLQRHLLDAWTIHRGWAERIGGYDIEDSLCAILFNAMGYLHELRKISHQERSAIIEQLLTLRSADRVQSFQDAQMSEAAASVPDPTPDQKPNERTQQTNDETNTITASLAAWWDRIRGSSTPAI